MPDNSKRREHDPADTGDQQRTRRDWFVSSRRSPDGRLPPDTIARGSRQKRALERQAPQRAKAEKREAFAAPAVTPSMVTPYWTPLGPSVVAHGQASGHPIVSGRVNSLAVGAGGTRVYAGTANGGLWYSDDSGASWKPIDEYALPNQPARQARLEADSLSTGAIAVKFGATVASDLIFVGTGEARQLGNSPVGDAYFGVGVKSSPSGGTGAVWTLEATNLAGHGVYRIAIDPEDSTIVFAATTLGLFMRPRAAPYDTWIQINSGGLPVGTSVSDVLVAGRGANRIYFAAAWGGSVYRSADAIAPTGGTWSAVGGLASPGRVVLATSDVPALGGTPAIVYALLQDATLWRLDVAPSGGFVAVTGVPRALFFGGQGYYDIALAVDPRNPNTVYVAGDTINDGEWSLSFYKGTITGTSPNYAFPFNAANDMFVDANGKNSARVQNDPTYIGTGVHADGHAIAFATNADGTHDATNVWVGSDGGVFQSTQSGTKGSFVARNLGLAVTQITYMALHPKTDSVMVAGAQDQGTVRYRGDSVCFEDPEGDGGGCVYDPNNGYRAMRQYTFADLYTAADGGSSGDWSGLAAAGKFLPIGSSPTNLQVSAAKAEAQSAAFYAPIAAVPVDATHTLAAYGTNRLWMTPDWGDSWTTIPTNTNPYAAGGTNTVIDVLGGPVTAIAWASPTRVLVATASSIFQFDQGGGNWTPNPPATMSMTGLPAGIVTALAVENGATPTVYATLGGGNVDHVWYFDPAAAGWVTAQLTQGMLDVPCHAIVVDPAHPEQVYVGTDVGVFKGVKTGATWAWTVFCENLPECAVTDLQIHPVTRVLRAATHGLGIWEIALDAPNVPDPDLYLRANAADSGRAPRPAWLDGIADPTNPGVTLTHLSSPDIKVLRSSGSTLASTPDFLGFASLKDFETDLNTYDTLGTNQIVIEVHNRGKSPVDGAQVRVLLLLADGTAPLPALPADLAARFTSGDTTAWPSAGWKFADPTNPYRALPGLLEARVPQVVRYDVDLDAAGLNTSKLVAAAFITAPADPYAAAGTDAGALALTDKHVAIRTLEKGTDWREVLGVVLVLVGVAALAVVAVAEEA
jgi:hypothetical protein